MQMTARFKYGLAALTVLAIAGLVFLLTKDDATVRDHDLSVDDPSVDGGTRGPGLTARGRDPDATNGAGPENPARSPGIVPGMRQPSGIDLSDPEVRQGELDRLLRASEINWKDVGKLLAIMTEPVPDDLRSILLQELKHGRRAMVMHAFDALRDPSFVEDLLEIVDDPEAARGARVGAMRALYAMPGADADTVALAFESRLSGDLGKDRELLFGIAARGGLEATRALVEYVSRAKQPNAVPDYILKKLDLANNPEAASVLADALRNTEDPQALSALVGMAGRPLGSAFTDALIDLDTDAQKPAVRARVLDSLAKIGDENGTDYLLRRAEEPGEFGEKARRALRGMYSADPGARSKLAKALETAGLNPKPDEMKESLLETLGRLRHEPALPAIAKHLDDPSARVRRASVVALGGLGPTARPHVRDMRRQYDAGDVAMKIKVAIAFGSISGPNAIGAIEQWLKQKNPPSLDRTLKMSLRAARDRLEREKLRLGN